MDGLKKLLGIVWLALAAITIYFLVTKFGINKLTSGNDSDLVFGIVMLFVLTPIIGGGLAVFGYYSLSGDYGESKK